jgi:hypothetical protein
VMPRALVAAGILACVARPADDGSLIVQVSENRAYALFCRRLVKTDPQATVES